VWIPVDYECDWLRTEAFIKQLQVMSHHMVYEICGGHDRVVVSILCHADDAPVLDVAFSSQFPGCELSSLPVSSLITMFDEARDSFAFVETCMPPPYTEQLTRPAEFQTPPLEVFLRALSGLPADTVGVYQAIVQPSHPDHRWHRNVEKLIDIQYLAGLYGTQQMQYRYAQQAPSGQLNAMANDVERKAHPDKPFFHVLARVGVWTSHTEERMALLRALATFMGLFQHGGQPLQFVSSQDYLQVLAPSQIREMFIWGVTHRPGTLLNSLECCGLFHLPPLALLAERDIEGCVLAPAPADSGAYSGGTLIGYTRRLGNQHEVHVSDELRLEHTHIIGRSGKGKSKLIAGMCLRDIERGHGVAVIDPHGDLAKDIAARLPEEAVEKCIYFEPGHPTSVPLWNPLHAYGLPDRVVDDFIRAFMNITDGWGHRVEGLFRQALYGLIACGEATLHNVDILLTPDDPESKRLQKRILEVVRNPTSRHFWKHEYKTYRRVDLAPAHNKLMKLLLYDTPCLMFAQKESRIDCREIMDNSGILIADLSSLGPEAQDVIGSLLLSSLFHAGISRSNIDDEGRRVPFHTHVDEMHRFVNDGLPKMLVEMRKFGCSLVLSSHYLGQVESHKRIEALSGVGTTIAFRVGSERVEQVTRFLGGEVEKDELLKLERQYAVARLESEVFRIKTPDLPSPKDTTTAARVKRHSQERYAMPAEEIYAELGIPKPKFGGQYRHTFNKRVSQSEHEEYAYDEL